MKTENIFSELMMFIKKILKSNGKNQELEFLSTMNESEIKKSTIGAIGLNSILFVELIMDIERNYNIELSDNFLYEPPTIDKIVHYIMKERNK